MCCIMSFYITRYCQVAETSKLESKEHETSHIRTIDYNFDEELEPQVDLETSYGQIFVKVSEYRCLLSS